MTTTSGVGQPADLGPDKARQVLEPGSSGTLRVRVPGHLGSLSLAQRSLVSWGRSVLGAQAQQASPPHPRACSSQEVGSRGDGPAGLNRPRRAGASCCLLPFLFLTGEPGAGCTRLIPLPSLGEGRCCTHSEVKTTFGGNL